MALDANVKSEILTITKCDLNILNSTWDSYFDKLIDSSVAEISREGITIDEDDMDTDMIVTIAMYTAYLYRKRADSNNAMPRMLRYRLNNLLFAEKAATGE